MLRARNPVRVTSCVAVLAAAIVLVPSRASAQDRVTRSGEDIGGHFGVVVPLFFGVRGKTYNIADEFRADEFRIGFPAGITIKPSDTWAFDVELVPNIFTSAEETSVSLTVHPGVLRDLGNHWTAGLRVALEINGNAWGFTPLLNKGFPSGNHALFIEAVVPIRFQEDVTGERTPTIGLGVHIGVGF